MNNEKSDTQPQERTGGNKKTTDLPLCREVLGPPHRMALRPGAAKLSYRFKRNRDTSDGDPDSYDYLSCVHPTYRCV